MFSIVDILNHYHLSGYTSKNLITDQNYCSLGMVVCLIGKASTGTMYPKYTTHFITVAMVVSSYKMNRHHHQVKYKKWS